MKPTPGSTDRSAVRPKRSRKSGAAASQRRQPTECVRELVLGNPNGLHARPATDFVDLAGRFQCEVILYKEGREANGKSIIDIMALGAEKGAKLTLLTRGVDARAALQALRPLLEGDPKED